MTMAGKRSWNRLLVVAFALGVAVGAVAGVLAFIRIVGGSGAPSVPISAPTLPAGPTPIGEDATSLAPESGGDLSGQAVFQIVPEESAVRFIVGEQDPRGTVVGITDQVAGEVLVDFDRPRVSQLGTVRVNVRTLETGIGDRDEALRAVVLESGRPEFEFAEFVPTGIEGLPAQVQVGVPVRIQVHGDLTVHGSTRPLTFFGAVTIVSPDEAQGFLAWAGAWSDFGLFDDPLVSHLVSEELILEISFVARRVR